MTTSASSATDKNRLRIIVALAVLGGAILLLIATEIASVPASTQPAATDGSTAPTPAEHRG
jgi:hypothetical protein